MIRHLPERNGGFRREQLLPEKDSVADCILR